jgi:hypothetical protein
MVDRRHARLAVLVLLAAALLVADTQLALTVAPALLIAAIPLSGAFFGEARILARRVERTPVPRPARSRWTVVNRLAPVSLLERTPCTLRGPPAVA